MNRMLYLRDLDVDVLIRCRACGHEGVLPHAEALRRFGASYPVLSIAPHYRCSACNARDAESLAAPAPEPLYATPVDHYDAHEDDGGFAAALASLQNLVEAAHGQSTAPKRKAAPEPEPAEESDFAPPPPPPPPINAAWDEDEEAAARAAWDAAPVWTPPPAALQDDEDDSPPPRRRRDTPALPDKPFFSSRERSRRPPEPPPPVFAAAFAADDEGDDDGFVTEEPKRDPADVPLSAMPVLSLADIKALLGDEDGGEAGATETGAEAFKRAPPPFVADDDDGPADAVADEDDEDDPLLSSALQRLLRNAPVEPEDDDAATESAKTSRPLDSPVLDRLAAPENDDPAAPFAGLAAEAAAAEEAEEELSDEELISFAIGDRDAASARDVLDALPPEMAALLADDDEDEVYEYTPDEIIDAPAEQSPPDEDPAWAAEAMLEPVADKPVLSASDDDGVSDADDDVADMEDDVADIDISEIVDFAAPPPPGPPPPGPPPPGPPSADVIETETADFAAAEIDAAEIADEEPLLLEDEAPVPAAPPPRDEEDDPDLAALRALLAETEDRDRSDDLDVDDLDVDDLALDGLETNRPVADGAQAAPGVGRGFERPPRDSLINDGDDVAEEPPPAWRTQRPRPDTDEESAEGMEDALATLRALIEQAAAEPDEDEYVPPPNRAPATVPAHAVETDDLDEEEAAPPPAFAARVSDDNDDDPEAWAALMREVAAKAAGDDGDDTLPLTSAPLTSAPLASARSASAAAPAAAPVAAPVAAPQPGEYRPEEKTAAKRGGSLDDTLTRLRGLLDLPQDEPPRGRGRRR